MEDLIRKIIKEEISNRKQEKLMGLIKDYGVDLASKVVGGIDNLFKILDIKSPMDFLHLFDDLDIVQREEELNWVLFRYKPKHNFIVYDRKNEVVHINYNEIWSVLEDNFGLKYVETRRLTEEWLSEVYNLRGVTTRYGSGSHLMSLSEVYNLKRKWKN
jgi:hypothetical protein